MRPWGIVALVAIVALFLVISSTSADTVHLAVKDYDLKESDSITSVIHRLTTEALIEAQTHPCVVEAKSFDRVVWTEVVVTLIIGKDGNTMRLALLGKNC